MEKVFLSNLDHYLAYLAGRAEDYPDPTNQLEERMYALCEKGPIGGVSGEPTPTPVVASNYVTPVVYFESSDMLSLATKADGTKGTNVEIKINGETISCYATVKVQGSSSQDYDKKNYTVKFYKDSTKSEKNKIDVGWGKQYEYCFKANYVDSLHIRNLTGAKVGYDMVESRPDGEFKNYLKSAPKNGLVDGFPIRVFVGGDFHGLYTWNIPKSDWMFNMDSDNPNHFVLCAEENNNGNTNPSNSVLTCEFRKEWSGKDGDGWSIEAGTYSDALKNQFNRVINFVINSTDDEFRNNISDYFDIQSLLDYYSFTYLVHHYDGLGKNLLMVTYDGGQHWGACLYDMDTIFGADWKGVNFLSPTRRCPEDYQETNSLLWAKVVRCFTDELKARYFELRKGALSLGNIYHHAEEIYDKITDRMFKEDQAKWSLPAVATNTMARLYTYMAARATYVDGKMKELASTTPTTTYTVTNNLTNATNSNSTTSINKNSSYSATINSNSGYTLGTITVTMGDTDISSSAVNGSNISISSVTGNIVITASATASSSGDTSEPIYTMNTPTVLNGTNAIDTGLALNDTEGEEFTIYLDYYGTSEAFGTEKYRNLLCMMKSTAPYPGFYVGTHLTESNYLRIVGGGNTKVNSDFTRLDAHPHKIAVTRAANESKVTLKYIKDGSLVSKECAANFAMSDTETTFTTHLIIGAGTTSSYGFERYWVGGVNECKVWNSVLTDEELTTLLS